MEEGVPQGTVLSPLLFNVALTEIADLLDDVPGITCLYADDLAILCTGVTTAAATAAAQDAIHRLEQHLPQLGLHISTRKTTYTPLTTKRDTLRVREANILLHYTTGDPVVRDSCPKYLGVHIDDACTMTGHLDQTVQKYRQRLAILHQLAGHDWGCSAHTLRQAYQTYALPTLLYAIGA